MGTSSSSSSNVYEELEQWVHASEEELLGAVSTITQLCNQTEEENTHIVSNSKEYEKVRKEAAEMEQESIHYRQVARTLRG